MKQKKSGVTERNGYWYINMRLNGKLVRKSTGLSATRENRAAALDMRKEFIRQYQESWYIPQERITLENCVEKFLEGIDVQESTKEGYRVKLEIFRTYMAPIRKKLSDVSETDIIRFKEYLYKRDRKEPVRKPKIRKRKPQGPEAETAQIKEKKKLSPNTIATYMNTVRIMFEFFRKKKHLQHNPVRHHNPIPTPVRIISREHKELIFNYLKERNPDGYNFVRFMDMTGIRVSELIDLKWSQIDYTLKYINIWNNKEQRYDPFPLYKALAEFIETLPKNGERVFSCYKSKDSMNFWKRACKDLGLQYAMYDLRRTFGTDMAYTMNQFELAALMRHRSLKTTRQFYLHIDLQRAGEKIVR